MLNDELSQKIQELYITTGSIATVFKKIKRAGYVVSKSTLDRLFKENKKIWTHARNMYVEKLAYSTAIAACFEDHLFQRLAELEKNLGDKLYIYDEGKIKGIDSQSLHGYVNVIRELKGLLMIRKTKAVDNMEIIDKIISALETHDVIGPIFHKYRESILSHLKV